MDVRLDDYQVRPATFDDIDQLVELFNVCSRKMIGVADHSIEKTLLEFSSPGFNMEESTQVVLSSMGDLIAYIDVWDNYEPPIDPWVWARVHPDYEGLGIGSALMDWADTRVLAVFEKVPPEAMVVMNCGTFSGYEPAESLFKDRGLTIVRYFWQMVIEFNGELIQPHWPYEVQLVPYLHDQDAETMYRLQNEVFRDHWGYVEEPFESGFERWSHRVFNPEWFEPTLWNIAKVADEIVGFVRCQSKTEEDPEMGWVNSLGVRKEWRSRGIGLALLLHALRELRRIGKKRAGLGVDANNLTGATRLYEKAGMQTTRQFDVYEKILRPGMDLRTTALPKEDSISHE